MSDAWPFTPADWLRAQNASRAVVNARLAGDGVLSASHVEELRQVLSELRSRCGDHPVLWETETDFTDDPAERRALYEEAKCLAVQGGWITYSIRMTLARLLLEEFGEPDQAYRELIACEPELASSADGSERREWSELKARCGPHGP